MYLSSNFNGATVEVASQKQHRNHNTTASSSLSVPSLKHVYHVQID